jgi:hypothetical protein
MAGGKFWPLLTVGTTAALLVVFHKPLGNFISPTHTDAKPALGAIAQVQGSVAINSTAKAKIVEAKPKQPLFDGDVLTVGANSHGFINGDAGWAFDISPNSQVMFEKRHSTWVMHVIQGTVNVLQAGERGRFAILKDGQWFDPNAQSTTPLKLQGANGRPDPNTQLSTATIFNALLTQKSQLQKCYAEWLQREPQPPPKVTLSFLVDPTGLAKSVELLGPFAETAFQSCVVQTIQRVRFPAYDGDEILMNIPLEFE